MEPGMATEMGYNKMHSWCAVFFLMQFYFFLTFLTNLFRWTDDLTSQPAPEQAIRVVSQVSMLLHCLMLIPIDKLTVIELVRLLTRQAGWSNSSRTPSSRPCAASSISAVMPNSSTAFTDTPESMSRFITTMFPCLAASTNSCSFCT